MVIPSYPAGGFGGNFDFFWTEHVSIAWNIPDYSSDPTGWPKCWAMLPSPTAKPSRRVARSGWSKSYIIEMLSWGFVPSVSGISFEFNSIFYDILLSSAPVDVRTCHVFGLDPWLCIGHMFRCGTERLRWTHCRYALALSTSNSESSPR
jgi:hypothetical protein